ncbi:MAG: transposase [Planctomycetaceae bacterium]|nr:transposase [Planctomycetaceae bacterium]
MPNWRRAYVPGGTFFFTVVTERRQPLFANEVARRLLGDVFRECLRDWSFELNAIVLLPDHLHAIWTLPRGDTNYPGRWSKIKREFTKRWLAQGGSEQQVSEGHQRDGRRGVWQPKYWEHTLEDEDDFERHFDYIHFNPVKHGLVTHPTLWPWSTFHRWVAAGVYPQNWGNVPNMPHLDNMSDTTGE